MMIEETIRIAAQVTANAFFWRTLRKAQTFTSRDHAIWFITTSIEDARINMTAELWRELSGRYELNSEEGTAFLYRLAYRDLVYESESPRSYGPLECSEIELINRGMETCQFDWEHIENVITLAQSFDVSLDQTFRLNVLKEIELAVAEDNIAVNIVRDVRTAYANHPDVLRTGYCEWHSECLQHIGAAPCDIRRLFVDLVTRVACLPVNLSKAVGSQYWLMLHRVIDDRIRNYDLRFLMMIPDSIGIDLLKSSNYPAVVASIYTRDLVSHLELMHSSIRTKRSMNAHDFGSMLFDLFYEANNIGDMLRFELQEVCRKRSGTLRLSIPGGMKWSVLIRDAVAFCLGVSKSYIEVSNNKKVISDEQIRDNQRKWENSSDKPELSFVLNTIKNIAVPPAV